MTYESLRTMITLNLVDKDVKQDHLTVLLAMKELGDQGVSANSLKVLWNEFINSQRHITGQDTK